MPVSRRRRRRSSCFPNVSTSRSPARNTREISSRIRSGSPLSRERSHRRMPTGWGTNWLCASRRDSTLLLSPLIRTKPISITTSFSIPLRFRATGSSRTSSFPGWHCRDCPTSSALNTATRSLRKSLYQNGRNARSIRSAIPSGKSCDLSWMI